MNGSPRHPACRSTSRSPASPARASSSVGRGEVQHPRPQADASLGDLHVLPRDRAGRRVEPAHGEDHLVETDVAGLDGGDGGVALVPRAAGRTPRPPAGPRGASRPRTRPRQRRCASVSVRLNSVLKAHSATANAAGGAERRIREHGHVVERRRGPVRRRVVPAAGRAWRPRRRPPTRRARGAARGTASRPLPAPSSRTRPPGPASAATRSTVASTSDTSAYQSSYTSAKRSP